MKNKLLELGFNQKEISVFGYLLEYGISSASEIARKLSFPKSTVNFLADNLWKKGFLSKSFRGKTGYYETDINALEKNISEDIENKKNILKNLIPELKEKSKNNFDRPKILFIDGVENCKKAYLNLLNAKEIFYEIGAHDDLSEAFGIQFMDEFIYKRKDKNIFCDSICNNGDIEKKLIESNKTDYRNIKTFEENIFGKIHSTIAIYDNKVLILNLNGKNNGVIIENSDFFETMKTIFNIAKR